jgi:hypothetical protein
MDPLLDPVITVAYASLWLLVERHERLRSRAASAFCRRARERGAAKSSRARGFNDSVAAAPAPVLTH